MDATIQKSSHVDSRCTSLSEERYVLRVSHDYLSLFRPCRALDSFQALLAEKSHCLAHPDALISAVGTKVYEFVSGQWREDAAWSALLGEGWDLAVAREAAYSTLAQVGVELAETSFIYLQSGGKTSLLDALDQVNWVCSDRQALKSNTEVVGVIVSEL